MIHFDNISACKYPFEVPYFYFYKSESPFCNLKCLRIAKKLYDEALQYCENGTPSIFAITSLLENEYEMKTYLEECKDQFLDKDEPLFPKLKQGIKERGPSHYEKGSTNKRGKSNIPWEQIMRQNEEITAKFLEKQRNPQYQKMKDVRRKLPAWSRMDEILTTVYENQVTIISGETGCGKSTQVLDLITYDLKIRSSLNLLHIRYVIFFKAEK